MDTCTMDRKTLKVYIFILTCIAIGAVDYVTPAMASVQWSRYSMIRRAPISSKAVVARKPRPSLFMSLILARHRSRRFPTQKDNFGVNFHYDFYEVASLS